MTNCTKTVRALGLCSGGLDSILSALVLREQGIEVEWISFETPFFSAVKARQAARQTGIPLTVQNITTLYLDMLKNPRCGYGQHMNPCMDCHALMFRLASERLGNSGFDFLFSGEVLGQRPMSQTRQSLRYVEKHSGVDGYILRPLSALRLPETVPEKNGWVDRSRLLDLYGRSRKPQIELANRYNVTNYPAPAGGCLLTDANYTRRLKDYFSHQDGWSEAELNLLKHGRHLRLDPTAKLVVGRSQAENEALLDLVPVGGFQVLRVLRYPGPIGIFSGNPTEHLIRQAAEICAAYTKAPDGEWVQVEAAIGVAKVLLEVVPFSRERLAQLIL